MINRYLLFPEILIVTLILLFCLQFPVFANNPTIISKKSKLSTSIGIDDLPWEASRVSLRWWKDEENGGELVVGSFISRLHWINEDPANRISLNGFSYYKINRKSLSEKLKDVFHQRYWWRGILCHV